MIKQNISINIKKTIRLIGTTVAMAGLIVVYVTFMSIYFGGWNGIISINDYGEANFEFVMLFVLLPVVIYTFFYNIDDICQEGREAE